MLFDVKAFTVSLRSSGRILLDSLSFSVDAGDSFQFLGLSGSGKTTLCNAFFHTLSPAVFQISGQMLLDGQDILSASDHVRRSLYGAELVYIPQNPMTAFDPSMRVGRQLYEILLLHGLCPKKDARDRALAALTEAKLPEPERVYRSFPYQLSGGMLQRVLFAMALMTNARLVVADEPTTALDAQLRVSTMNSLKEMKRHGAAVVMMTHDFRSALRLGGQGAVLQGGKIVETNPIEALLNAPAHPHTRQLISASMLEVNE